MSPLFFGVTNGIRLLWLHIFTRRLGLLPLFRFRLGLIVLRLRRLCLLFGLILLLRLSLLRFRLRLNLLGIVGLIVCATSVAGFVARLFCRACADILFIAQRYLIAILVKDTELKISERLIRHHFESASELAPPRAVER